MSPSARSAPVAQPPPARPTGDALALVAGFVEANVAAFHERLGDVVGVAVCTAESRTARLLGASSAAAAAADAVQLGAGEGPCLDALRTGEAVAAPDLAGDRRWGDVGRRMAACGPAASYSTPVLARGRPVAVLGVYAAAAVDDAQRATADLLAKEISGGFGLAWHLTGQSAELHDLTAALTHRRVIDLALGILMERAQVPADAAFVLLRARSQERNLKLRDVAAELVATIEGTDAGDLVPPFEARDEASGTDGW